MYVSVGWLCVCSVSSGSIDAHWSPNTGLQAHLFKFQVRQKNPREKSRKGTLHPLTWRGSREIILIFCRFLDVFIQQLHSNTLCMYVSTYIWTGAVYGLHSHKD